MPPVNRVANHITLLGTLWIVYSIFTLIGGLMLLLVGRVMINFLLTQPPPGAPPLYFLRPFLSIIGLLVITKGVFSLAAGWGLLRRESWGRILALVMGCISLVSVPFGTSLGIYTLWTLISTQGEQQYRNLSAQPR